MDKELALLVGQIVGGVVRRLVEGRRRRELLRQPCLKTHVLEVRNALGRWTPRGLFQKTSGGEIADFGIRWARRRDRGTRSLVAGIWIENGEGNSTTGCGSQGRSSSQPLTRNEPGGQRHIIHLHLRTRYEPTALDRDFVFAVGKRSRVQGRDDGRGIQDGDHGLAGNIGP